MRVSLDCNDDYFRRLRTELMIPTLQDPFFPNRGMHCRQLKVNCAEYPFDGVVSLYLSP